MPYIGPNSHIDLKINKTPISLVEQCSCGVMPSLKPPYADTNEEYSMASLFSLYRTTLVRKTV